MDCGGAMGTDAWRRDLVRQLLWVFTCIPLP